MRPVNTGQAKEKHMRNFKFGLIWAVAMIATAVIATSAAAVNHYWYGGTDANWQDGNNWTSLQRGGGTTMLSQNDTTKVPCGAPRRVLMAGAWLLSGPQLWTGQRSTEPEPARGFQATRPVPEGGPAAITTNPFTANPPGDPK